MKPVGPDQPLTWFWFSGCLQQRLPRICTKQLLKPNAGCSCISLHCVETDKLANFCNAEKLFSPALPRLCILLSNTTIQNHRQGHPNVYEPHHKGIQQKHKCICDSCVLGFHTIQYRSVPAFWRNILTPSSAWQSASGVMELTGRPTEISHKNEQTKGPLSNIWIMNATLGLWYGFTITTARVVLALTRISSRQALLTWSY